MPMIKIGRTKYKIPAPTRFDRLSPEDLYLALEQSLANCYATMDQYAKGESDKQALLYLLRSHVETATAAVNALIRKRQVVS